MFVSLFVGLFNVIKHSINILWFICKQAFY